MELNELEAIDRRVQAVQAKEQQHEEAVESVRETEPIEPPKVEDQAEVKAKPTQKAGKKKKKA